MAWLDLFLRKRFFLGRFCFSFPILRINFFLEFDLPIDSLDTAPIFEIRVLDCFHNRQNQNFFVFKFLMFMCAVASDNLL